MKAKCSILMVVLLSVLALAGCGGGSGTEDDAAAKIPLKDFQITLDGYPSPENVSILLANDLGYFLDARLDVFIFAAATTFRPIWYVANRSVAVSVSHQPQVALAREKGVPIVAVGSLVSEPTASMIWLKKSGIDGVADLKGKTIAVPGLSYEREFLRSVLARAGLSRGDVKVEVVDFKLVSALVSGQADAIFGGSWNVEGVELESRGFEPVITRVQDLGIPDYNELVVIAREDRVANDPRSIRAFLSAVHRATEYAIEHPKAAAEAILKYDYPQIHPKETEAGLEATLPLLSRTGRIDPEQNEQLIAWMAEQGMVESGLSASEIFTNDYLPQP